MKAPIARALAMLGFLVGVHAGCAAPKPIVIQAELTVATTRPSFQGTGYVYGFTNHTGEITFNFDSPKVQVADLSLRYWSPAGGKGYQLSVNGVGTDGFLPPTGDQFLTHFAGKVELQKGTNTIVIGKGWGFYELDSMTLQPSKPYPMPKAVPATLANPGANASARALMKTLASNYGKHTYSGVINQSDLDYVREVAGTTPAIMGGDLIEYSPSRRERGADPKNETERLITAHRQGHMITLCWHWNAPKDLIDQPEYPDKNGKMIDASWYRGFYINATTFDFSKGLDDPASEEHKLLLRDIDAIAIELRKLQDADVPVLWRPLHESDGAWFWWGARGPDNFKRLWRLLYDRLTHHHGLNNLIWVYTWEHPDWYPGDDVVDVVGMDCYPSHVNDTLAGAWTRVFERFDGKKLIALTEFGGVPDIEKMNALGIRWAWFASWSGPQGPRKNAPEDLSRIYRSKFVSNLREEPKR